MNVLKIGIRWITDKNRFMNRTYKLQKIYINELKYI
jgi:hypothetical protein